MNNNINCNLKIKNNLRFSQALKYINESDIIADIGCDHGYLGIQAILNKKASFVQFIDNKKEPLNQAWKNIKKTNINNNSYELSLSNGLNKIKEDVNKVIIMGMGGELIIQLLSADYDKITSNMTFILQANTKVESLREYLFNNHFIFIIPTTYT